MKRNSLFRALGLMILTMLAALFGTGQVVAMGAGATGVGSADAGRGGAEGEGGVETLTEGQEIADPEFYEKFVDQEVTKVQPTSTPLLQLVSYAKKVSGNSITVKYYTNGYRPYKTSLKSAFTLGEGDEALDRWKLPVADNGVFTVDDTILVIGVHGYDKEGHDDTKPLMLVVCEIDKSTGMPCFFCANGRVDNGSDNIIPPASIASGTKLLRMGKAAPELAAQTGSYYSLPRARENHVQKFMTQVEASTIEKIQAKEIKNFSWSDQEEDAIIDMKRTMEFTFLWGVKSEHEHEYGSERKGKIWTCDGVWDMASKQLPVGTYDLTTQTDVITEDDMVDVLKDLYAGTNLGGKQKVLLCGSDFLAALSKMKSTRLVFRDTVEKYGLKFKSFDSEFGELLAVHAEVLNAAEKSKWAFAIDPDYLRKYTFRSWSRNVIDKNAIGVSETEAAVLREMSCCYLKYGPAHARLYLASVGATPADVATITAQSAHNVVRPKEPAPASENSGGQEETQEETQGGVTG